MRKFILKPVISILLLLPAIIGLLIYFSDYQEFINHTISFLQLEAKREAISNIYLTANHFGQIQIVCLFFTICWLPLWFWSIGKLEAGLGTVRQYFKEANSCLQVLKRIWNNLPHQEKKWAIASFVFLTILRFALSAHYPIQVDEAFSYVFLVDKGSLVTASFYPGPNNHVAYLFSCSLLNYFLPADWAMRLPSLLFLTAIYPILFLGIRRFLSANWTWLALSTFSLSEYSLYYSTHGRGYSLQFACLVLLIFSWLFWYKKKKCASQFLKTDSFRLSNPSRQRTETGFLQLVIILSATLGCYAVPSFVYFLFACGLYALLYFPKVRKAIITQSVYIALLTVLLYSPILLLNDWATITQNPWVKPLEVSMFIWQLIPHWAEVHGNLLGYEQAGWVIMLTTYLASWRLSAQSEEKGIIQFLLFVSLFCYLPSLFQRVLPFTRVFWVKGLADFMLIAWVLLRLLERWKITLRFQKLLMAICFLVFLTPSCWETGNYLFDSQNYYNQLEVTISNMDLKPHQHFLVNEDAYAVRIKYLYAQNNWGCVMETNQFSNQEWLLLNKKKHPKAEIPLNEYQLWDENQTVWIYKKR